MVTFLRYLLPAILLVVVWLPVIRHYHVPNAAITDDMIDKARSMPSDEVLREVRDFFESYWSWSKRQQSIDEAEKIMRNDVDVPVEPARKLRFPFDADDIDKGPIEWQMYLASLKIPDVLIRAFEATGRDEYLMKAGEIIVAWAAYERTALLPKGLLWNDGAVTARIPVLARFWRLYRNHKDYEPETAKAVLSMAARSGGLLSKESHFTYATNHGIMQNLALWQICLAFPTVAREEYKEAAYQRMGEQMKFYVNDEGVVLEHSAWYHRAGLEFMSMAFRYLTLMDLPVSEEWKEKYEKAKKFYANLRRPDGSLPMFGDTRRSTDPSGPRVVDADGGGYSLGYESEWSPEQAESIYPVAGYAVWWNGLEDWPKESRLSQTMVLWSYFPGHAHKHADEMSVLLWAGGQTWLTNVGYWPYGVRGREKAVSWQGSNAPHLVDEPADSNRRSRLLAHGSSDHLAIVDLERVGPDRYSVRRQVITVKPDLWLVLDHSSGVSAGVTRTIWTTSQDVTMSKGDLPGLFLLKEANNRLSLTASIITSGQATIGQYKGSKEPFAGWELDRPAPALMIEQSANGSWTAAVWALEGDGERGSRVTGQSYMKYFRGPEEWELSVPLARGALSIVRVNDRLTARRDGATTDAGKLTLAKTQDTSSEYGSLRASFEAAQREYPKFKQVLGYRFKMTYLVIGVFVLQEVLLLAFRSGRIGRSRSGVRALSAAGWLFMLGAWLILLNLGS